MAAGPISRIPFAVMATVLAAMALAVVAIGYLLNLGAWSLAFLAIPVAVALVYLLEYPRLPYGPPAPVRTATPDGEGPDSEEFDDPVEEADRMAREGIPLDRAPGETEPVTAGSTADPPAPES